MSLVQTQHEIGAIGVPRASGDEPRRLATIAGVHECSPRERG